MIDIKEVIKNAKSNKVKKVQFAIPDIDGILRSKVISAKKFLSLEQNEIPFCNVIFNWDLQDKCYNSGSVCLPEPKYPDKKATLDLNTVRQIPWNNNMPYVIADFSNDEQLSQFCPRTLLRKINAQAKEMGYTPVFAQEFEWFNFSSTPSELHQSDFKNLQPITPSMFGYSQLRPSYMQEYFNDLYSHLSDFDVPIETMHTETGPGVYEAAIEKDTVLNAADKACLFKTSVKEIAYRHNIIASFMAKWNEKLPGSGGHLHQSIWDQNIERNLFATAEGKPSELMESYVAGILYCLPCVLPMYAPTINSYKRLNTGDWAPNSVTWGNDNRTTAIRTLPNKTESARVENRVVGADANPYLAMAASLASGLYGIRKKLKLQKETFGSAYGDKTIKKLPNNLRDAIGEMINSEVAKELFGDEFVAHFCKTRKWECVEFEGCVTDWELRRYFEII